MLRSVALRMWKRWTGDDIDGVGHDARLGAGDEVDKGEARTAEPLGTYHVEE